MPPSFFRFSEPPERIVIRMPNWLGDLVMATPILTDLRHHWPETKITAMCQGSLSTVIQEDPNIDFLLNFSRPRRLFGNQSFTEIVAPLRKGVFDLGILLTNSLSSAYWFWRGEVKHRVGYATHGRSFFLNHPVELPPEIGSQHLVRTYKMILQPLGIPLSKTAPALYLTPEEENNSRWFLTQQGIEPGDFILGINPGAAYGSAKCWLPERFKQLTELLLAIPRLKMIYFGDKNGAPLVRDICKEYPPNRVIDLAGKTTLRELMAYIQRCHLFLTNDSGPMHVASALGVPLVALFGSTSDITTSPYREAHVIHKHVSCSPCYRRECPIDFRCMTQITVQEVYDVIQAQFQLMFVHKSSF